MRIEVTVVLESDTLSEERLKQVLLDMLEASSEEDSEQTDISMTVDGKTVHIDSAMLD